MRPVIMLVVHTHKCNNNSEKSLVVTFNHVESNLICGSSFWRKSKNVRDKATYFTKNMYFPSGSQEQLVSLSGFFTIEDVKIIFVCLIWCILILFYVRIYHLSVPYFTVRVVQHYFCDSGKTPCHTQTNKQTYL